MRVQLIQKIQVFSAKNICSLDYMQNTQQQIKILKIVQLT